MPRNGSGTYNLPTSTSFNPASTGGSATAPDWNALAADISTALSNSIATNGETTVVGNIPLNSNRITGVADPVGAQDAATKHYVDASQRSYLAGLILSNDGVTPNTVLDIAAGFSVDSTNTVGMSSAAFTKTTGGAWVAGTGNAGMGTGLTIANTTWYHVFQIINSGSVDFYFDTSVTAANKPTSTTAFRRIGSFRTNGSAQIITFVQDGDLFQWLAPVLDVNAANPGTAAVTRTLTVPTGVNVQAMLIPSVVNTGAVTGSQAYISDLATTDTAVAAGVWDTSLALTAAGGTQVGATRLFTRTNTSAQVRSRLSFSDANVTFDIVTLGWIDRRGRDA